MAKEVPSNVIIHCDAMLCTHSNVIIHCGVTNWMSLATSLPIIVPQWGIPSNVMSHCDVIMSHGT